MRSFVFLFLCLISIYTSNSQEKLLNNDSSIIAEKVREFAEAGKLDQIITELNKLNPNDSLYNAYQVTKAYYLIELEKYDEAIDVIDAHIDMAGDSSDKSDFYLNRGNAYSIQEMHTEAIANYEKGLEEFPKNHEMLYNMALSYEKLENTAKAAELFKEIIKYRPLYQNAHLKLGALYSAEDKIAQALMCLNMYLLINPDGDNAFNVLNAVNNLVSKDNELSPKNLEYSIDDSAFTDLNVILRNRIALQEGFEIPNKINVAFVKQNYAMLSQLSTLNTNGGFFEETYIPFYTWISNSEKFNEFTYTTTYSIRNEEYKKLVEKELDVIKEFLPTAYSQWLDIVGECTLEFEGEEQKVGITYLDGQVSAIGKYEDKAKLGKWYYYDTTGKSNGYGSYDDNGNRDGIYAMYHDNGELKEKGYYKDDTVEGVVEYFYTNGKLNAKGKFQEGQASGEYLLYNNKGGMTQRKVFIDDNLNGPAEYYYDVGEDTKRYNFVFKENKVQGEFKEYYPHGIEMTISRYTSGEKQGLEKEFYPSGEIAAEYNYVNGLYDGKVKTYFPNGQIQSEGIAKEGLYEGPWKTYYSNGIIEGEFSYDQGKYDGLYKSYDIDGKLHSEFVYRSGDIKEYKYFAKDGSLIREEKKKGGELQYVGYSAYNQKISEGVYDIKGGKTGLWKFYSKNGVLIEEGSYVDNKANGEYRIYYPTGELKDISNYKDDALTGYFVSYYPNGKMKTQGFYLDALAHGPWEYYQKDGNLESKNYYHKGDLNGTQDYYSVEGKQYKKAIYRFGELIEEIFYDKDGKEIHNIDYNEATTIQRLYPNGKVLNKVAFKNGQYHGAYEAYDFEGNISAKGAYINDIPNGEWIFYYPDGTIKSKSTQVNGNAHGAVKVYFDNGQLEDEYEAVHGLVNGTFKTYNESGVLVVKSEYLLDELHGRREFFDEKEGTLQMVRFYSNGRLLGYSYLGKDGKEVDMIPLENETGNIITYYPDGTKARETAIKNGNFEGKYVAYHKNGNVEHTQFNVRNDYEGESLEYYYDGTLKQKVNYVDGMKQGLLSRYYPNGKLKHEINFKNNKKSGEAKFYDEEGNLIKTEYYFNDDVYDIKKP